MIIAIEAPQGYGKTSVMALFGYIMGYEGSIGGNYYKGLPIFSKTRIKNATHFGPVEENDQIVDPGWKFNDIMKLHDCIILWDEIADEMDSRAFKDTAARVYVKWLVKVRHNRALLIYTCQDMSQVEKRLRLFTDYVWWPRMENGLIRVQTMNYQNQMLGRILTINPASVTWDLFDSYENIIPIDMPQFDQKRKRKHDD